MRVSKWHLSFLFWMNYPWLMVALILSVFILCWVSSHLLLSLLSVPAYARGCREEAAAGIEWTSIGRPQCQAAGDWPSAEGERFPTTPNLRMELMHRPECRRPCFVLKAFGLFKQTRFWLRPDSGLHGFRLVQAGLDD